MRDVYLQLPDRRLRARWFGALAPSAADGYAPTLVFLHEGLGCVELWRSFPETLCARTGLRGFAYDRTGYGLSGAWPSPPGPGYMAVEADLVLPQVLDRAGIESCLLVGHSDGGTIALDFAAMQPPLLRAVVTIGAHAITEPLTLSSIRHARTAFLATDLRARLARYHHQNVDGAFWLWNDAWLSPGFEPMDAERRLPRVRVPVLALQGEHDEYGTPAQLRAIERGVSGRCETRLMPGCGHGPHLQDEATMVAIIARFAATLWRGPSGGPPSIAGVLALACACLLGAARVDAAQADPCATPEAQAAMASVGAALGRGDDEAAAAGMAAAARATGEVAGSCHEIGVAALALDGWAEARRLANVGGAPDALTRMREALARLEAVRVSRPPTALIAQLAAYADAVLRAAVAAAQDERDEMQVYLAHARTLAESLRLARYDRPWPLPIDLVEGELWLEVDRFVEAKEAFARVTLDALVPRASLGLGQALDRLGETGAACAAYRTALAGALADSRQQRARESLARLRCGR